ncbi:MAG: type II toxin-antitoxin system YafQ family toxin [Lewinellaceae bacterium]|nr:type II toxin-antitoxin system YafQ family toxin [Lewinellaceae bacterium]
MFIPQEEKTFRKDLKRVRKRGKDIGKLKTVVRILSLGGLLPPAYRDHMLTGNYKGFRECHIEPDWLLIYRIVEPHLILVRTGSHADLFR